MRLDQLAARIPDSSCLIIVQQEAVFPFSLDYSCFEEGCAKKRTRHKRKEVWVVTHKR